MLSAIFCSLFLWIKSFGKLLIFSTNWTRCILGRWIFPGPPCPSFGRLRAWPVICHSPCRTEHTLAREWLTSTHTQVSFSWPARGWSKRDPLPPLRRAA
jgi:hypothetical protein